MQAIIIWKKRTTLKTTRVLWKSMRIENSNNEFLNTTEDMIENTWLQHNWVCLLNDTYISQTTVQQDHPFQSNSPP